MKSIVLTPESAQRTLQRMAYEMVEQHYGETQLILAGIVGNGLSFAQIMKDEIQSISNLKVEVIEVNLDKKQPFAGDVSFLLEVSQLEKIPMILMDDVANSGSTLFYGLRPWMNCSIKSLKTAVLVDRSHKRFPISPNFIGISLATTLQEHVEVVIENRQVEAFLL